MLNEKQSAQNEEQLNPDNGSCNVSEYVERNIKFILIAIAVILVIILGTIFFKKEYIAPKEKEAREAIFQGERYFAADSFRIALHGDGMDYVGFEDIIDEYGLTKTAQLAKAYAGLCCKELGDYAGALDYLNDVDFGDVMISPSITGAIGDCYIEMDKVDEGIKYFMKAVESDNSLLSPLYMMKAATAYESLGKYTKALDLYNDIKVKYPLSDEASDIDKYIDRAEKSK